MAKRRRKPQNQPQNPALVEGEYQTSTGTAELIADDYTANGWVLRLNGMESSHIVIDRPRELDFEYMRWLMTVVEAYVDATLDKSKLRVTHLGGGACSMARYLADVYPLSRNTVVELDAKLAELVREWFDLPKAPTLKIRVGEARAVTETFAPQSRDVIIRDVLPGTSPRYRLPRSNLRNSPRPRWQRTGCTLSTAVTPGTYTALGRKLPPLPRYSRTPAPWRTRPCLRDAGKATLFLPGHTRRCRLPGNL